MCGWTISAMWYRPRSKPEELAVGHVEAIQLGARREAEVPVVDVVEAVYGVDTFLLRRLIP